MYGTAQPNHYQIFRGTTAALPSGAGVPWRSAPIHLGRIPLAAHWIALHSNFVYAGADGGTLDVYLQTTMDLGVTWCDVGNIRHLQASARRYFGVCSTITLGVAPWNPTNMAMGAPNTCIQGFIGDFLRIALVLSAAYATSTLAVDVVVR